MAYKQTEMRSLLVATIAPSNAVDKAINNAATTRQAMATYALAAIRNGELTIEDFKAEMISAYASKLSKVKAAAIKSLADCGNTYKGIYYDIRRVALDKALIARVVDKGEPITTVRRDTDATQPQKGKGNGSKPTGKGKPSPSLNDAADSLIAFCNAAVKDATKAKELASNPKLAELLIALVALDKAANAKPARKPRAKKAA